MKPHDEGTKAHQFPHAIVVGVERAPLKVTKNLGAKKTAKRTKVKPFVKLVNYNHLMPTRYSLDVESFKSVVTSEASFGRTIPKRRSQEGCQEGLRRKAPSW